MKKHCFVVNKTSTSTVHQLIEESGFVTRGLTATQIITAKTNNAKDLNIRDRISKFQSQLKDEYVYRIPLKCFLETGKINSVVKIDFRIKCHLATEIKKLFESKKGPCLNSFNSHSRCKNNFHKSTFYPVWATATW